MMLSISLLILGHCSFSESSHQKNKPLVAKTAQTNEAPENVIPKDHNAVDAFADELKFDSCDIFQHPGNLPSYLNGHICCSTICVIAPLH
jgi:hypothetical protein